MEHIGIGFVPLRIKSSPVMMVGEAPGEEEAKSGVCFSGGSGRWLQNMASKARISWENVTLTNTILCRPPGNAYPTDDAAGSYISKADGYAAVAHCKRVHLDPAIAAANKPKIYAVGAQALLQLTGKRGITMWRGSPLPLRGGKAPRVMPIIHPAALMRQAKFVSVTVGDMRKTLSLPPENYNLFPTLADVQRFRSRRFAFDFEWDRKGITLCGLSDRFYGALVVPFVEPYITELRRIFEDAEELIGHNIIGADLAWIERMGWKLSARIEDTMLKQHLIQPDLPHGLDFVASVFTQKVFWKGKGWEEMDEEHEGEETSGQQWRTWDSPDALPRSLGGYGGCLSQQEAFALYNGRDTDAEFQIDTPISRMLEQWGLRGVYENVSRPAAYICRWMGERGLRLDTSRLSGIREIIDEKITAIESHLPDGLAPYEREVPTNLPAPKGTFRPKRKTCKGLRGNSHEPAEITFLAPTNQLCPTCGRSLSAGKMDLARIVKGTRRERVTPYNSSTQVAAYVASLNLKEILDRKTGNATTGKQARGIWAKDHPEFVTLGALKKQITLRNNFAKDSLLGLERMFFNLKVHGTNEGRLSASGQRKGIDLNIQNQPQEFRSIYIPEHPDWGFVNIDISQGESWLTCWIAEDADRWKKLQTPGYDEHSELASEIFQREINKKLAKEDPAIDALRQIGKKTNHASAYGMGYRKFHEILVSEGFDQFAERDAKLFLEAWKSLNKPTVAWQRRTVEMMQRQGYLRNAFGRVRWFGSRDGGTQCLAFLPASTLADMMIRMMIAHYPEHFIQELQANKTQVYHSFVPEWIMSIMVHDSLALQGPWVGREEQIERSSQIMTQPFSELGGFAFNVDVKSSQVSWGSC